MLDLSLFDVSRFPGAAALAARTVVVTPTYLERDTVEAHVRAVSRALPGASILLVDDASPDGTADAAEALRADFPHLSVLRRPGPRSFAGSYRDGIAWALERGFSRVVSMDADGSHPAVFLPLLLDLSAEVDVAIGSRYLFGVSVLNWPLRRVLLSAFGNIYARWVTGVACWDLTSGFCCYRADALRAIDLPALRASGYAFQIEMKYRVWRAGLRLGETSILFVERLAGFSKISSARISEGLLHPWWCRMALGRPEAPPPGPVARAWPLA
jgi:dolichol-phosphate mannosyltransferase